MENLKWKVHANKLFQEILNNEGTAILTQPLNILMGLLTEIAARAIVLDDKELNKLMIRLSIYSVSDPESDDYDPDFCNKYLDS